ncbi:MAG: thiamine diphosphokinase [Candidatus Izemoplasmatales bacterium]|jgi:thiamine pyrophosphokinase|nr:thiamine diphosphokinase [Candidatus Izemoplasmatales bacterium]MDD4595113.1 thiamine diphosphokinase [Candidatus Izemoplasmatales bacterium]
MPKNVKIFCGPNNYTLKSVYFEESEEFIVGVDSGLDYLIENAMVIDLAIGDFDSVNPEYLQKIKTESKQVIELEKAKNMTDLTYAVDYIYNSMDYETMTIFGGIGGRIDHLLANLNILKKYDVKFCDNRTVMYALKKGKHHISNYHKYISFFAIEDCYNLSIRGFRYELDNYYLSTNDSLCVSNSGSGIIEFSKGRILVISTDDQFQET